MLRTLRSFTVDTCLREATFYGSGSPDGLFWTLREIRYFSFPSLVYFSLIVESYRIVACFKVALDLN